MLAEIFMVRLEAAARLQEQTASLSSTPFVPFATGNQFLFKDNRARPLEAVSKLTSGVHLVEQRLSLLQIAGVDPSINHP